MRRLRGRLIADLFRDSRRETRRLAAWQAGLVLMALAGLAIVLQMGRVGRFTSTNVIWAEDGHVFLEEALTQDFLHAVFATYATYLVVVPRLIAEAVALAPLKDAAVAISLVSAATVALCGLIVWLASAAHIRNPYLRATLAILTVLPPAAGIESVDSATYVLWFMLFAVFWILLWRPATWWGTGLVCVFTLITALSTPGVWFFAPIAALRAVAIQGRRDAAIVASYAVGAVAQIPVVLLSNEVEPSPVFSPDIWTATLQRLIAEAPLGLHLAGNGWKLLGWPLLVALTAAGAAGLLAGFRKADTHGRWVAGLAVATGLIMFVVSLYQRAVAEQMVWTPGTYNFLGSRYVLVPSLLLISGALVLLDRSSERLQVVRRVGSALPSRGALVAIAVLAIAMVSSYWLRDLVLRGTPWKPALANAEYECELQGGRGKVSIPTSPPGYLLEVPCDRID